MSNVIASFKSYKRNKIRNELAIFINSYDVDGELSRLVTKLVESIDKNNRENNKKTL